MAREEGEENIHRHAKAGELWNLRAECEKHVDLDRQSAKGYTALHLAAMYGRFVLLFSSFCLLFVVCCLLFIVFF